MSFNTWQEKEGKMGKIAKLLVIVSVVVMVSLVQGCAVPYNRPTLEELGSLDYGGYPLDYEQILKDHLNETLFDPYSIGDLKIEAPQKVVGFRKFVRERTYGYGGHGYGGYISFNAKNRMGGYVGKIRLYYIIRDSKVRSFIKAEDIGEYYHITPVP